MTGYTLALDPGASCGLALLQGGVLVRAVGLDITAPSIAAQAARMVGAVQVAVPELRRGEVQVALIERPTYWRSTPDMPALISLALLAGAAAGGLLALGAGEVRLIEPRTWKGTTDKATCQRCILASLTAAERALLPRRPECQRYQSDALDAAGLALWAVGRLGMWHADPASFAADVDPAPVRSRKRKPAKQVQGGLAFDFSQGPRALHVDDVDALLAAVHEDGAR